MVNWNLRYTYNKFIDWKSKNSSDKCFKNKWNFHTLYRTLLTRLSPADTRCWINAGLTLVQRRRRWTNVKPTSIQHIVSDGSTLYFYIIILLFFQIIIVHNRVKVLLCFCLQFKIVIIAQPQWNLNSYNFRFSWFHYFYCHHLFL